MEFHLLKTFATVAREGSITRASERLSLSQPAVSAHIKAIEEHLDVTLFERTPRGLGIGLLHGGMAIEAQRLGEVDILCIAHAGIRNVFAHLVTRAREPMFVAIATMLDDAPLAVQAAVLHANVQEPRAGAPSSAYLMSAFRKHK